MELLQISLLTVDFIQAEKNLRKIISHSVFTFNNKKYKAGTVYKPQKQGAGGETKTDAYFIADNLTDKTKENFKISYKKTSFSFIENKLTAKNAPSLYGKKWSNAIRERTSRLMTAFKNQFLFYETAKPLPGGRFVYAGSIVEGWRNEFEAKEIGKKNGRDLSLLENTDIFDTVWANANKKPEYRNGVIKEISSNPITGSGEPNYFLKMKIENTTTVNEIFKNVKSLGQIKKNMNIFTSFLGHSYDPINMKQHGGTSRSLAVVVDWKEKDDKLTAKLNFKNPLETNSNSARDKIKKIIEGFGLELGTNFDIKKFKKILDPSVRIY